MSRHLIKDGKYVVPVQQLEEVIIPVFGYIKSVNHGNKSCVLYDIESQTNYTCTFEGFLPLSEMDAIAGLISQLGRTYKFVKKPLVKISVDRDTIIKSICKSLKFQIKMGVAEKLYDALLIVAEGDSVDEFLDNLAIDLHEKQVENFSILPNYLNESQVMRVLKWWYKSRTLRKLYLLGLNNKEIRASEMIMGLTPTRIYDYCLVDPFKIIPIPIDKCKSIYDILGSSYDEGQVYRATIVRKIYYNTVEKAWTGTPSRYLLDQFKDINKQLMEKLKEEYKVVGDLYTLYLDFYYKVEVTIAEVFTGLTKKNKDKRAITVEYSLDFLTDEQKFAIHNALISDFSIISGGPGTGKTLCIVDIVANLERLKIPYAVAAFTGKAVAKLKEVLRKGTPATLHMMISRKDQILPFKFLIIDEASMVTTELMYFFCKAFGCDFQIVLVGDVDQLQPISYGNMFSELIASKAIQPVYLTKNHRSALPGSENNDLLYNIQLLVKTYYLMKNKDPGEFIENPEFKVGNNFFKMEGDMHSLLEIVTYLSDQAIKSDNIMIICPYVKYQDEINRGCQKIFNEGTTFVVCPRGTKWCIGDKVKVISNVYHLNLMNGDMGSITDVNPNPGASGFPEIMVEFKSGQSCKFDVTYDPDGTENTVEMGSVTDNYVISNNPTLSLITLGYATTVHSAQGDEREFCLIYLPREDKVSSSFINFNLLYTAITRAKKMCFIIGDIQAFDLQCTVPPPYRVDNLAKRIQIMMGCDG